MSRILPLIVFVIVLGAARIIGALSPEDFGNFSPLGALFFCGMAFFGWRGIVLPAFAWFLTYPVTSAIQGYPWSSQMLVPVLGFLAMIGLARLFQKRRPVAIFVGSLVSAVLFYLVTNTLSWVFDPGYAVKSFATWGQALTIGLPQYQIPTWAFFRNSLLSQTIFSALFIFATVKLPSFQRKKFAAAHS